MIRRRIS